MVLLKLISTLFIFLTSSTIGYLYGKTFSSRFENLIYLEQCIKILETEIVYAATPLPEALSNVFNKGKKKVSYIFDEIKENLFLNKEGGVYNSFLSVESKLYEELYLQKEDVEVFLSLGRVLGTSDRKDQQKNFTLILNQIDTQILEAKIERNKNEKLYRSLGIITGVGIIILLV
ncbi:stage III sporulation protein AB [Tissierella praeacuta]|uniref:stage III sporulation protein AB n=1 Tax=Tissierella praeacuta TaxID=43131 RepID=UPI000EE1A199|nr:stage III sporulation protein AB [Tissierella praeacuta]HAE91432.1 stage III sporulation protein AB [Tissierella sp.]